MRKYSVLLLTALIAVSMAFVACKPEPEPEPPIPPASTSFVIEAKNVVDGNDLIKTVKAMLYWETQNDDGEDVIATCKYENNGFKLTLPNTVANKYLSPIEEEIETGIIISDPNAKIATLYSFHAFNEYDDMIGEFYSVFASENLFADVEYVYADRDFTIKGEAVDLYYSVKWDCSFKKGWNTLYLVGSVGADEQVYFSYTTQKPAGVDIIWDYYELMVFDEASVRFKKEENTADCIMLGVYQYDAPLAVWVFANEAGLSPYYMILPGNYDVVHWDAEYETYVDIIGYNFAKDRSYTVVCSGEGATLSFNVIDEGPSSKSAQVQHPFKKHKTKALKGKSISKMKSILSQKSKTNVK